MIEPTETESRESLDIFASALLSIAKELKENPDLVKAAPHTTPVRRLDEVAAARKPNLRWTPLCDQSIRIEASGCSTDSSSGITSSIGSSNSSSASSNHHHASNRCERNI